MGDGLTESCWETPYANCKKAHKLRFEKETPDMTRNKKHTFIGAGVLALALALTGCLGGSSSTMDPPPVVEAVPTPLEMAEGAFQTAQDAMTALAPDASSEMRRDAAQAVVGAADAYLTHLAADADSSFAEAARVQSARSTAMAVVDSAQAEIDAANTEEMVAQGLKDASDALAAAQQAAMDLADDATGAMRRDAAQEVVDKADAYLALLDADASYTEVTRVQNARSMAMEDIASANAEIAAANICGDGGEGLAGRRRCGCGGTAGRDGSRR